MILSDDDFEQLITKAMDELPQSYIERLDNVAIVQADEPTEDQIIKMRIDNQHLLLGLYEGIPLTHRGVGYNFVLPDKITLFKYPILTVSRNEDELFEHIKRTLWHEMAHHYGLDHDAIDTLQNKE